MEFLKSTLRFLCEDTESTLFNLQMNTFEYSLARTPSVQDFCPLIGVVHRLDSDFKESCSILAEIFVR